jgi:hypothetical protein
MPSNFSEGIELEMRFSPMKIVEGKCASKYCEVISAETLLDLSDARQRTDLVRRLPLLDPAEELWDAIAGDVSTSRRRAPVKEAGAVEASSGLRRRFGHRWLLRSAAMAAAIFIIAAALLLANRSGLAPGDHKGELNLAGYLDLVGAVAAAEQALREFPAAPGFTEVRWPEARTAVAFPAIVPEVLPGGYKLAAARLYSLGSLRALQFKYRSEQDALCVFQLPSGSKLSFGNWPSEQYHTDGVFCWRGRNRNCALYRFVLGETQCALMTRQTDPAVVDALIQAFKAEAGLSQAGSVPVYSANETAPPPCGITSPCTSREGCGTMRRQNLLIRVSQLSAPSMAQERRSGGCYAQSCRRTTCRTRRATSMLFILNHVRG